jgi:ATP-dependent Clp protease ATP-binding subunit ClpA
MTLMKNADFLKRMSDKMREVEAAKDTRRFDAAEIAEKIKSRVIGQDVIADTIAAFVARKAARRTKKGTIANILISGPTGTGKSEMAKAVSEAVFGSEEFMLQIDCGNMGTSPSGLASLVGSPSVYQGSSRGALADYLTKTKGEGVILFDEYEKAAPTKDAPLGKMLLKLMDEGKLQSQYDMSVLDAMGCIVILTSNLKQKELAEVAKQITDPEELELACKRVLSDAMAPEFLERIDLVTTTAPLSRESMAKIVMLHFERLAKSHDVNVVDVGPGFFDLLVEGAEKFGQTSARGVIRWLGKIGDDAFIEAVNQHHWRKVIADWDGTRLVLSEAREQA